MHGLEHAVPRPIHILDPQPRRLAPRQTHDASGALRGHNIDDLLRELLPSLAGVRVRIVRADSQGGVKEQHATVRPRREQAGVVGWGSEGREVVLQTGEDVLQRGRGNRGRADGEAQAVRLIDIVVGVLADDHRFDSVEGCMSRPFRNYCQLARKKGQSE